VCVCVCDGCVGSAAGLSPAVDLHTGAGEDRSPGGSSAHLWTGTVLLQLCVCLPRSPFKDTDELISCGQTHRFKPGSDFQTRFLAVSLVHLIR